ncbi:MAG TPA: hypothetical protein VF812_11535 [Ktedonobacterales bacterium]
MDPRRPSPDRPNTLGQAWQSMNLPRARKVADLPPLPDWPPLPDDQRQTDWPPLGPDLHSRPEFDDDEPDQRAQDDAPGPRWRMFKPFQTETGLLGRWRYASKRARLQIAGVALACVALIAACSGVALHVAANIGSGAGSPFTVISPTQQTSGQGATSSGLSSTPGASSVPTSLPTSTVTSTANVPLALTFTCASGSVRGSGQVCVHTLPATTLNLTVRYCDGSYAKGLRSVGVADTNGNYTWTWPIHVACAGAATATVTAKQGNQTLTATKTFSIAG